MTEEEDKQRAKRREFGRIVFEFLHDNDDISIADLQLYFSDHSVSGGEFWDDYYEWWECWIEKQGG